MTRRVTREFFSADDVSDPRLAKTHVAQRLHLHFFFRFRDTTSDERRFRAAAAFRLVRVSDTKIRGGVRRGRVSRWRRMTGTHAYSLIGRGSSVASLTSASASCGAVSVPGRRVIAESARGTKPGNRGHARGENRRIYRSDDLRRGSTKTGNRPSGTHRCYCCKDASC